MTLHNLIGAVAVKNFAEFVRANKEKIYSQAEKNTKRNAQGHTVISRDDSWFYEDEWNKYYNALVGKLTTSGGFLNCEVRP